MYHVKSKNKWIYHKYLFYFLISHFPFVIPSRAQLGRRLFNLFFCIFFYWYQGENPRTDACVFLMQNRRNFRFEMTNFIVFMVIYHNNEIQWQDSKKIVCRKSEHLASVKNITMSAQFCFCFMFADYS